MSLHRIIYNAKLLREIILKQLRYRHIIRRNLGVFNAKTKCVALEQFEDGQTLIALHLYTIILTNLRLPMMKCTLTL
ncbi:hypothetical protein RCL_jg2302.t1 [Rhizophagus clarus]|uniref:Uncharacterized protein n=1 Tax=Rhizophagus clarus TaxID=94130 RepID=A0A8H3KSC0_9GLOM|nr:hypothetical protein RCL_jg2302.t1 [Rhizophagus clarus]